MLFGRTQVFYNTAYFREQMDHGFVAILNNKMVFAPTQQDNGV
jgi:hypothetical protein